MYLLALAAILGWALIFARWLPGRPGTAIFLAQAAILSMLYTLACLGQLWLGATLLFWAGNAALVGIAMRQWASSVRFLTSVPCVLFVFYAAANWLLFSEAQYYFWDEFTQWGLVTREMLATHNLYDLASNA